MSNIDDIINDIEEDIKNRAKEMANEAADELTKRYKLIVSHFYFEYAPHFYKREHTLYDTGERYYKNNGKVAWGGVHISSDFIWDIHQESPDVVFDSFEHGYHGKPVLAINYGLRPIDLIKDFRDELYKELKSKYGY